MSEAGSLTRKVVFSTFAGGTGATGDTVSILSVFWFPIFYEICGVRTPGHHLVEFLPHDSVPALER